MKSNNNISQNNLKSLHYIYITYCTLTGEYYFGKHSTNNKNDGYNGSGKELNRRKKQIGGEHFKICYIARFGSEEEAYDREEDLIRVFISDLKCLNKVISARIGQVGYGIFKYPSGKIAKLRVNDPDVLNGLVVGTTKGKPLSEEHKQKLSKAKIGKKLGSYKPRTKPNKPRPPHSEETKQNISKGRSFDLSTFSLEEITLIENLRLEKVSTRKISTILLETFNRKLSHETIRKYF